MQSWQFVKASREFPEAFSVRLVNGGKNTSFMIVGFSFSFFKYLHRMRIHFKEYDPQLICLPSYYFLIS